MSAPTNCPANPEGIGPMLRKLRNPFSPNTTKISPSSNRAIKVKIFILTFLSHCGLSSSLLKILSVVKAEDLYQRTVIDGASGVNRSHSALLVIFNCLTNFAFGVHYKRTVARDWFVEGHAGDEQHFERSLRVGRIFDSHFVAVLGEQNHLPVRSALAFRSELTLSLHDVR